MRRRMGGGREGSEWTSAPSASFLPCVLSLRPVLSPGVGHRQLLGTPQWHLDWLVHRPQACILQHRHLLYLGAREESPGSILLEVCWRQGFQAFQDAGLPSPRPRGPLGGPHLTQHRGSCGSKPAPGLAHPQGSSLGATPQHRGPWPSPWPGLDLCPNASDPLSTHLLSLTLVPAPGWVPGGEDRTPGPLSPRDGGNRESVQSEV